MTRPDLSRYGSADAPLRASGLHHLVSCNWRSVAEMLAMTRSESGKSADTGSAAHHAIAALHNGATEARALAGMREALAAFPLADLDQADRIVAAYWADPRNRDANVIAVETRVTAILQPWTEGEPVIVIHGTADQVRLVDGVAEVWDVKTGDRDAVYMQQHHSYQLAAYTLGFGGTARPGGYIRTRGYFTKGAAKPSPRGVFIPACIPNVERCLDAVRLAVSLIRHGHITANPGDQCGFCPLVALEMCLPKLREIA